MKIMTTPAPHTGIADARKETQIQKGRVSEPRGTIHSLSVHSPGYALGNNGLNSSRAVLEIIPRADAAGLKLNFC